MKEGCKRQEFTQQLEQQKEPVGGMLAVSASLHSDNPETFQRYYSPGCLSDGRPHEWSSTHGRERENAIARSVNTHPQAGQLYGARRLVN